jgi:hypothetical protein
VIDPELADAVIGHTKPFVKNGADTVIGPTGAKGGVCNN